MSIPSIVSKGRNGSSPVARKIAVQNLLKRLIRDNEEAVFSKIYKDNVWGGDKGTLCSGHGSDPKNVEPYIEFVAEFIKEKNIKDVVDIGCGDFRIAKAILEKVDVDYLGIDIVKKCIRFNNQNYAALNVSFEHLDILSSDLPLSGLCLVKQVFQHFSNEAILKVLPKLRKFKYVIITDENNQSGLEPEENEDIATGCGTRATGLYLEKEPFLVGVKPIGIVKARDIYIRTVLIETDV